MEFDPIRSTDDVACLTHISDPHLLGKVAGFAEDGDCAICASEGLVPSGPVVNLEHLARVVHEHMIRSFDNDGLYADGEQWLTPMGTERVVEELLDGSVHSDAFDLLVGLVSALIDEVSDWFVPWNSDGHLELEWDDFEETVKHVSRLMRRPANGRPATPPERTFAFLQSLLVFTEERAELVREIPAGTLLHRARIERDARKLEREARQDPAAVLGPPPRDRASAGRMNAQGVPLLYVALEADTACAEVAAHSAYSEPVIGAFEVRAPLRVLDLSRVPPPRSVFDDTFLERDEPLGYFSEYVERITRPVILDGNHPVDYAPTQVITEFFRWASDPPLDGIIYPSRVREAGLNAVLFFGEPFWFLEHGKESSPITRRSRANERGSDDPLFVIDPETIERRRVERKITVRSISSWTGTSFLQ